MPILQVKNEEAEGGYVFSPGEIIPSGLTPQEELDVMVRVIKRLDPDRPDAVMSTCMAFMARCTEMYLTLRRAEAHDRKAKVVRTMELEKVMELIEFTFRGASRIVEVRRQDTGLAR